MPASKQNRPLESIEMMLRRLQSPPWQPLYLSVIGFVLIPLVRWSQYDDGSVGRLIVSLGALLVALRVVPAIARKVVPFSADLQAEWFNRRRIAKKYDSYQWRKLLWIGIGLGAYVLVFDRHTGGAGALALACVVSGGLGVLGWRRVTSLDPLASELR